MPTIYQVAVITLLTSFVIMFMNVSNLRYLIRDACDSEGLTLLAKMLNCDFCFSFWLSLLFAIFAFMLSADIRWIYTPFLSTSLIRILL